MNDIQALNLKLEKDIKTKGLFNGEPLVFGEGNVKSPKIALIGEAPGKNEELQKKPFVGAAGKNLSIFLEYINMSREDIYITNVVKHRTTKLSKKTNNSINRTPNKQEIEFYTPYILQEIALIKPTYVVTLGNTSLKSVANTNITIGNNHGNIIYINDMKIFPLYHPASIIYNKNLEEIYIQDLKKLQDLI
jgi:uracil-DNA glycosylase